MATLNDLIDPGSTGIVNDDTVVSVLKNNRCILKGHWYEDKILEYLNEETKMIVYNGIENTVDIML